jgi:hypothetical protein
MNKKYEILLAWQSFYKDCSNEWESIKIAHKIEAFEQRNGLI